MVSFLVTFYQLVIYIRFNVSIDLLDEHLVHKSMVYRPNILQSKQHHLVAKKPLAYEKQHFLLARFVKLDLVITEKGIHEAQVQPSSLEEGRFVGASSCPLGRLGLGW